MRDANQRIEVLARQFIAELTEIAKDELVQTLRGSTFGGRSRTERDKRNEKRSPERLEALQRKLLAFLATNPGMRIEQINAKLGTKTRELALPIKKLLASKSISSTGARRATKYFLAGSDRMSARRKMTRPTTRKQRSKKSP